MEGLIATTSTHLRDRTAEWRIREIVEAYGKVRPTLLKHEKGFPPAAQLSSLIKKGIPAYGMEGDTPSFLSLINNGLNVPERPDLGGWGGRYELYTPRFLPYRRHPDQQPETRSIWTDAVDAVTGKDGRIYIDNHATIWRWRDAYQHDFAARMDWCILPYEEANHPPAPDALVPESVTVQPGEWVTLDASGSFDPDGDDLSYRWIHYIEAGDYWSWRSMDMKGETSPVLTFRIPSHVTLTEPAETHLILEVTDDGTPGLARYRRVIVTINPG